MKTLKLIYFAQIKDDLGLTSEMIVTKAMTIAALLDELRQRGALWQQVLSEERAYRVAVNQVMVSEDVVLSDGDEVAIFPPVTGG